MAQRAAPGGLDAGQGWVFLVPDAGVFFSFFYLKKKQKKTDHQKKKKNASKKKNPPHAEAAIARELAAGKTWLSASPDSRGRPYILSPSSRHLRSSRDLAASKLSLVYAMDAAARLADAARARGVGDGRVVSVIDARGVGLANLDPDVSRLVVEVAQVKEGKGKKRAFFFPHFFSFLSLSFSLSFSLNLEQQKTL